MYGAVLSVRALPQRAAILRLCLRMGHPAKVLEVCTRLFETQLRGRLFRNSLGVRRHQLRRINLRLTRLQLKQGHGTFRLTLYLALAGKQLRHGQDRLDATTPLFVFITHRTSPIQECD